MSDDAKTQRRAAMLTLAGRVRSLVDATVNTGVAAAEVDAVSAAVADLVDRLEAERHPGPYSGLLGGFHESTDPADYLPLSPTLGRYNPIAPPLVVEIVDGRVHGTVRLGRPHIGPPAAAHGGVTANLCDQMVAVATTSAGLRGLTRSLSIDYLAPTPLYVDLVLEAWVDSIDERTATATTTISHDDTVVVRATAVARIATHVTERDTRGIGPS